MALLAVPALVLTLATFVLALLWRLGLLVLRRRAPGFWGRTLRWHAGLFAFHLFVTVPVLLGVFVTRHVGTRPDEAPYAGPRLTPEGDWIEQTRETLAAEKRGEVKVDSALVQSAKQATVSLTARDGVKLRAFLVPAREAEPRFVAVLAHGIFRGGLEIETPGRMLRDLGGEVLLLEWRNHGGSDRARATFGLTESLDVLAAVDFLRARPEARGRPLIVYAVSLGTAAAGIAAPQIPDLAGLVLDAPVDNFEAVARGELGRGGLAFSIVDPWASTILLSARYLGGAPIADVKPGEALRKLDSHVPVLLIGAGHDERVTPESVRALFEKLPTPPGRKEIWIEPEATHGKVWAAVPDEYRAHLARLCDRALAAEAAAD
jgi:uncharacterized protein